MENETENKENKLKIELIKVYISHIMNIREQIPLPLQLLFQNKQQEKEEEIVKKNLKLKRYENKINLIYLQYNKLIEDIYNISLYFNILKVGIFLGPSPICSKEGYILYYNDFIEQYMNNIHENNINMNINSRNDNNTGVIMHKINQICKKVIRKFIEYWSQVFLVCIKILLFLIYFLE